jgi:dihydroxyacetone kinase phosphoprotein-dependent L subunit
MSELPTSGGGAIVRGIADVIVENRAYLSEIDGKIGDGDHGNNMAKGFARAKERISEDAPLGEAMHIVADVLMGEIGGSMGPLYGMFFDDMASAADGKEHLGKQAFGDMLEAGCQGVMAIGEAKPGDKTLLDTLVPAIDAFRACEGDLREALDALKDGAAKGRDATTEMIAKVGRSSRLGERSRGVPDAGATSCCMILTELAEGAARRLS